MSSTEHCARGFTVAELLVVLVLAGVLAAVALPKLDVVGQFGAEGWREQTVAGLRWAQATAIGHRRLVCASFDGSGLLQLRVAAANPAGDCSAALRGPDGSDRFGDTPPGAAVSVVPNGSLYFQPSGQVTLDAAGNSVAGREISVSGASSIRVAGQSGHVE
ncbi:MAG: prepilin-type N-terminal cleavage/methylation domain-containing protein [Burkholderiales bacterium]|nr:prepilin-type N-terminal cleavage/methylation domain-containing protein [Burkholderiales bacterium]